MSQKDVTNMSVWKTYLIMLATNKHKMRKSILQKIHDNEKIWFISVHKIDIFYCFLSATIVLK